MVEQLWACCCLLRQLLVLQPAVVARQSQMQALAAC
jgi:hypothetical protein